MKNKRKLVSIFLMLIMVLTLIPPMNVEAATKVKINKTKTTIYMGSTETLKITGTSKKVTWSSSNEKVATVSSKGKVTPKKNGTTTITAKVSKKKYTCKVTVKKPTLNATRKLLKIGKTYTLKLTGATAKSFKSSKKSVATVNSKGKVTAKKAGIATITVKDKKGKSYKCTILVKTSRPNRRYGGYWDYVGEDALYTGATLYINTTYGTSFTVPSTSQVYRNDHPNIVNCKTPTILTMCYPSNADITLNLTFATSGNTETKALKAWRTIWGYSLWTCSDIYTTNIGGNTYYCMEATAPNGSSNELMLARQTGGKVIIYKLVSNSTKITTDTAKQYILY